MSISLNKAARPACHINVINYFAGESPQPAVTGTGHPPLCRATRTPLRAIASRAQSDALRNEMRDLADDAAAERQHAGDEDHALDHRHPLAEPGQILLHRDDHEGADHRAEDRTEAPDQRHQHDFARHRPLHVGQRGVLRDEHLQRAGKSGQRSRQDVGQQLVLVGLVAERDRARLVFADRFQHLAER